MWKTFFRVLQLGLTLTSLFPWTVNFKNPSHPQPLAWDKVPWRKSAWVFFFSWVRGWNQSELSIHRLDEYYPHLNMGGFSVNSHFQDMADLWKCRTTEDAPLLTVPLGFLTLRLVHIERSEIHQLFGLSRVSSLPHEVSVHKCPLAPLSLCAPPCVSSVWGGS